MPNLASFAFDDSLVRTRLDDDGRPWFVAKDLCAVLELEKYRDAISRLDEDERGSAIVDTPGGPQEMSIVSESGLYSLIFRSRKPEARRFRKWVTAELIRALPYSRTPHFLQRRKVVRSVILHKAVNCWVFVSGSSDEAGKEDL